MLRENISENIKKHRLENGVSQEKLAGDAGISVRYLQRIEAKTMTPSVMTIFKISKALGVDYSAIMSPAWQNWLHQEHADSNR